MRRPSGTSGRYFRPNACHTRNTVDCDRPARSSIERVDQRVAFFGLVSSVNRTCFRQGEREPLRQREWEPRFDKLITSLLL